MKRISAEKRAEVIAELTVHLNAKAVADKIEGVSFTYVWTTAKRAGIELTAGKAAQGHHRLSPEKRAEVVAALNVTHSAARVAKEVGGISEVGVWKIAKREGIELYSLSPEKRAEVVAALNVTHSAARVAREIGGISVSRVWQIALDEGIELAQSGVGAALRPRRAHRRRKEADQYLVSAPSP